jgi:hypothetical protein
MNFFTTERFTNALQAVGNIIAPLPEDYEVKDDNHESLEENREENSEDEIFGNENHNEIRRSSVDRTESREDTQEEDVDERREQKNPFGEPLREDEDIQRMDSIHSADWSPPKENVATQEFVNLDTEPISSEPSSPHFNPPHSPDFREEDVEEVPVNHSENGRLEESKTLEDLQNELRSSKSKVASAFAEISSLSDDLREAIGRNRDVERKLESEKETNRMLLSRIESLSQSKEELVIQLSEALELNDHHRKREMEFGVERAKEKEAHNILLERYELAVSENRRLTEDLTGTKEDSRKGQEAAAQRCQDLVQRIATAVFELLEETEECSSLGRGTVEDAITEQALFNLMSQAAETLKSHKSTKKTDLQVSHSHEVTSLTEQIQQLEGTLSSEINKSKLLEQQLSHLQQTLNQQTSHCSTLEQELKDASIRSVEVMAAHREDTERYLKRIQELEKEQHPLGEPSQSPTQLSVEGEGSEGDVVVSQEPTQAKTKTERASEEFFANELKSLRSQLGQLQQEKDELHDICQSFIDSNPNQMGSLREVLEGLGVQWKALQSAHETSLRNELEISNAHSTLRTEHQVVLKSLQEVTHERDSLKRIMTEYKSKLDELLKTITEMKNLKEENDNSKREFIR